MFLWNLNSIDNVMVCMLMQSVIDCGFKPRYGQIKDFGSCCFSANHAAFRSKSKDRLVQNQDNVSKWRNMSTCELVYPVCKQYKTGRHYHLRKSNLFSPSYCSSGIQQLPLINSPKKLPFYAPATVILIYPCPSVCPSGYRYMFCSAISSYSFGATALIFCMTFMHIMEVCMSTSF